MNPTVTFLTLFLSLVTGPHPVEVAVRGEVAKVELRLDGQTVTSRAAPPWRFEIDFGPALMPHELEAVAFDEDDHVVARNRQFVNLPQQSAQTQVLVRRNEADGSFTASISATSAVLDDPIGYRATLNGLPLDVTDSGNLSLGILEERSANILSVEALFPNKVTARTDVTVGAAPGSKAATDLTAVAVETMKRIRKPDVGTWDGALGLDDGTAIVTSAVERPAVRLYVVRSKESWPYLKQFRARFRYHLSRSASGSYVLFSPETGPQDDQLFLVDGQAELRVNGQRSVGVFELSLPLDLSQRSVEWTVTHVPLQSGPSTTQALADSVAVAGLMAAASKCPRAVLLIIADQPEDKSHHRPSDVTAFLDALHVPLYVWRVDQEPVMEEVWGTVIQAGRASQLKRAAKTLKKNLTNQLILWVEGRHMPNRIRLEGGPEGAVILGSP